MALCLLYVMSVSAFVGKYGAQTLWHGHGTRWNPYLIQTPENFITLYEKMTEGEDFHGVFFRQTEDLDFGKIKKKFTLKFIEKAEFIEVGTDFAGVYDGAGHILKNLSGQFANGVPFGELSGKVVNLGLDSRVNKNIREDMGGRSDRSQSVNQEVTLVGRLTENGALINCWNIRYAGDFEDTAFDRLIREYGGGNMLKCWSTQIDDGQTVASWLCRIRTCEFNLLFWALWAVIT